MMHARWPILLFAAIAGCSDAHAPADLTPPALAKPGAAGVRILDLGTLGGTQSYGYSLNTPAGLNSLLIVGNADPASGAPLAAYWLVDVGTQEIKKGFLPSVTGATQSTGYDVNQAETIVGWTYFRNPDGTSDGSRATRWAKGAAGWTADLIPTLNGSRHDASTINASGWIAGASPTAAAEEHFYLFDGATTIDRGGFGGPVETHDVNVHGTIVGASSTNLTAHAFISYPNAPPELLPNLGGRSGARAINDQGEIVGYSLNTAGESRAVRWTRVAATGQYVIEDLGLARARAWDINNEGEIVGSFVGRQGERGFYQTRLGTTKELPILSYSAIAFAINERADVAGISVFRNTYTHAVLWTNVR